MKASFHGRTRGEWAVLVLFALLVGYRVFVPPVVGLANNGDFGKVFAVYRLDAPPGDWFTFLVLKYNFAPEHYWLREYVSSEEALAGIAILLNAPFSKPGTFDLRWLGAVHVALYVLALYLLQPLLCGLIKPARILFYCALILVFSDAMYVTWMNTAYMDAGALLFLLLGIVFYLRALAWKRTADQAGFVIAAVLFTGSKAAHSVPGLVLAGLLLMSVPVFRSLSLRAAGTVAMLVATVGTFASLPATYRPTSLYNTIFYQLLPHSKDVHGDLLELGLDDSYRRCIGTHAYLPDSPFLDAQFAREFGERVSHPRLAWFLLRHPALTYRGIRHSLDQAGRQRPYMGNFTRESGAAAGQESQAFAYWSRVKRRVFENWGSGYLFYFLSVCGALCGALWRRYKPLFPAGVCLCLMGLLTLGISSLADALEVTRHFFLFNALTDIILICALAAVLPIVRSTNAA